MYINQKRRSIFIIPLLVISCILFTACSGSGGEKSAVSSEPEENTAAAQLLTLEEVEDLIESDSFSLKKTDAPKWLTDVGGISADDEEGPEPSIYEIQNEEGTEALLLLFVLSDYISNDVMGWTGSDDTVGMIPIWGKNIAVQIVSDEVGFAEGQFNRVKLGKLIEMREQLLKCLCEKAFGGRVTDFSGESENWVGTLELKDYTSSDGSVTNQYSQGMVKFVPKNGEADLNRVKKISAGSQEMTAQSGESEASGFIPFQDGYTGLSIDELLSEYDIQITYTDGSVEQLILSMEQTPEAR